MPEGWPGTLLAMALSDEPIGSVEQAFALKAVAAKVVSYIAAGLGIGTFMGLVNVTIGVLSAIWLAAQLYGYIRYELPTKRYRRAEARRDFERQQTMPAPLEADE